MSLEDPNYNCGVGPAFKVIGGKWKAVILWELNETALRFGVLRRLIPDISEKMLIQQLREMVADRLITRFVQNIVPPHVEYSLTPLGASLNKALCPLADWGALYVKQFSSSAETEI